jgi:hypothetical protein
MLKSGEASDFVIEVQENDGQNKVLLIINNNQRSQSQLIWLQSGNFVHLLAQI